ncbi:MAG: Radical protein [Candidatus Brocadiaceae bacterium]|nr:Radical protein [Candidatus Brocadiaceae bacterium]
MFFINPDSRTNKDIPNLAVAYAATLYRSRVVDLNTMPDPGNRFCSEKENDYVLSVQSRSFGHARKIKEEILAKYPNGSVRTLKGILDVQCCYPFVTFDETLQINTPFSDALPFPEYSLFDSFETFLEKWQSGEWYYPLMTSIGCPFQCTYCMSRCRIYQTRTIDNCVDELKQAQGKWRIRKFCIMDDCFNLKKSRVLEFADKVKPLGMEWICSNGLRADLFDEEIADAIRASGCKHLSFGIESASDRVLGMIRKGETLAQIEKAVAIAKPRFDSVNGFFIFGLPETTLDDDIEILCFILKHGINAHLSVYVPFDKGMQVDAVFNGDASLCRKANVTASRTDQVLRWAERIGVKESSLPVFFKYACRLVFLCKFRPGLLPKQFFTLAETIYDKYLSPN